MDFSWTWKWDVFAWSNEPRDRVELGDDQGCWVRVFWRLFVWVD